MGTIMRKLGRALETKEAIRQAIIGKGQAVADTDPFSAYPEKISAIETGVQLPELTNPGSAADLLAGKQLVDQYGNPLTGTMPEAEQAVPEILVDADGLITASAVQEAGYVAGGTKSAAKQLTKRGAGDLTASGAAVTVPAGYYPSQVSKSVATAAHPKPTLSRSGGTVTASHTQSAGYTSGGTTTETLSIPIQAAKTVTPTTYAQTAVSSGRLTTGAVTVAGDANLVAGNIRSGVSIFGVAGTLQAALQVDIYSVTIQCYTESYVYVFYCNADPGIQMARLTSYGSSRTLYVARGYLVIIGYGLVISTSFSTAAHDSGNEALFIDGNGNIQVS